MSAQLVEVYRDGKLKRMTIAEIEEGHFIDSRVVDAVKEALEAARDDGIFVRIVKAWRQHGEYQDGIRLELYLKPADHDEFVAIVAAHGLYLADPAKPGHFIVSDRDKTPVDIAVKP